LSHPSTFIYFYACMRVNKRAQLHLDPVTTDNKTHM
jgi:hypothetical protein